MYTNELKVIEVLLNYLDNKENLNRIIDETFHDNELFNYSKINLFNLVCIKSILSSNPNLSNKDIDSIVNNIEVISSNNLTNKKIYEIIINEFKNNHYSLDKDNNILIYSKEFNAIVTSSWLYNLATISRNKTFNRALLFNKNEELDITDEKSLLNYLYHTKIFLVNMKNNEDLENIYKHALINTKGYLIGKESIKSYDIKELFLRNVPSNVEINISKYDFNNYRRIINILNNYPDFYNLTLKKQKIIIEQAILGDESTNTIDYLNLNKYILSTDIYKNKEIINDLNIEECYIALFKMYMYIISNMNLDYSNLYLSKIRIKTNIDESMQEDFLSLKSIVKEINNPKYINNINLIKEDISKSVKEANELRDNNRENKLYEIYGDIAKQVDSYVRKEKELQELGEKRNSIQNLIHYKKSNSVLDISFDNDEIMKKIEEAIAIGRLYVDNNNIVIEINNKEMGMNTFTAIIPIDDFLYLVECTNEDVYNIEKKLTA